SHCGRVILGFSRRASRAPAQRGWRCGRRDLCLLPTEHQVLDTVQFAGDRDMEKRVYNFSPGPAVLPLAALEEAQRDLLALPGAGISILEISHRSKKFEQILNQAESNLRTLLGIPSNYRVLFLQG